MISRKPSLREVYVWQLPVRIFHWVNAFTITVLIVTGFIIGDPPAIMHGTAPEFNYWFGWVRLAHFIAAFIFVINLAVRIYWAFAGNTFARWNNFVPITRKQIDGIFETIKVDVLLLTPKPVYDIGHNALAAFTYFGLLVVSIVQIVTGFSMFSASSDAWYASYFQDLLISMNGFFPVRNIHHILMWFFVLFIIVHVYLVFYHDYIERNGIASSMIGGWKFINEKIVEQFLSEEKRKKQLSLDKKMEETAHKKREKEINA